MTAIHTSLTLTPKPVPVPPLVEQLKGGLDAPICLTWELTYACNLACVHCLSSSGRRDPKELTTLEALGVVDELADLQVFYVNLGGGEPMIRKDFLDIVDHAVGRKVGVKFSTNGYYIDQQAAERFAATDLLDIQISLDGFDAATNDAVRGPGSWEAARRAMDNLAAANFGEFKISIVATRHNVAQLDDYKKMADDYGAQLRVTRLRPSGRGVDSYQDLRLTHPQQQDIFRWIMDHPDVLTGDSFFHLNALGTNTGETLPGLSMCGAGRIVCLIDPIGDVYACPFVIHDEFMAGNVRDTGGFGTVWRESDLFRELRQPGAAPVRLATPMTRAEAVVWQPSSSRASRSMALTPTVFSATPTKPLLPQMQLG
jgi:mycofactocin radical SAM maturase